MQDLVNIPHHARTAGAAAGWSSGAPDQAGPVFDLLSQAASEALGSALITLVEVEGGSARDIGAHMAVLSDGRYCGYVSGGCLEAAIAAEAMQAIEAGRDRVLRFGVGSPFLDIRLPCGGSIELHVHVDPDPAVIASVREHLRQRHMFALDLTPETGKARVLFPISLGYRTGWHDDSFRRCYLPQTRLVLAGRGLELEQVARIGSAAGLEVFAYSPDEPSLELAAVSGLSFTRLTTPSAVPALPIDPWTAVVLLFHDHDWESSILLDVLRAEPFFIGALGSKRTHQLRRDRLLGAGLPRSRVDSIHGPVGLFGPTRDATSLAFSILAQLTECRLTFEQA